MPSWPNFSGVFGYFLYCTISIEILLGLRVKKTYQPLIGSRIFQAKLINFALAMFSGIFAQGKIFCFFLLSLFLGQLKKLRNTFGSKITVNV